MLRVFDAEGIVLSGGENQKLSIARALYKDKSPIMILDEPSSALDAFAEQQMYENFSNLIGEKSALFISHRLASTRFCDRIALLSGGNIVEFGTHDELMKEKDDYYRMYEAQAAFYREEEE